MISKSAEFWIKKLDLISHPEGGYYKETYRSQEKIIPEALPQQFTDPRDMCTAIYFLLKSDQVSSFHRIKSDEIWTFHTGSSLTIHTINPEGKYKKRLVGPDPDNGETLQYVVKAGCWFGATVNNPNSFSLVGCIVSPGFDYHDFELADQQKLLLQFPQHASIINKLTKAIS